MSGFTELVFMPQTHSWKTLRFWPLLFAKALTNKNECQIKNHRKTYGGFLFGREELQKIRPLT
jgi:hypothetical protein